MSTAALVRYMLDQVAHATGAARTRVLLVTTKHVEYQSGLIYHGLREMLGSRLSCWRGQKPVLYAQVVGR